MPILKDLTKTASNLIRLSSRTKTKERRMLRKVVSTLFLFGPKCFECQDFGHMNQECLMYLKTIGKSKALVATLSDIKPEDDSDNENDEILNVFTTTVNPIERIVEEVDEEEDLMESTFEKMDG